MVNLPDGLIARIEYHGNVAPKVTVERRSPELAAAKSPAVGIPFSTLERASADMDRQLDAMFRQVRMLDALPADNEALMNWTSAQTLPAGATSYRYVAAMNGKDFCARSVEITSDGPNRKPKGISSTSGDCGTVGSPTASKSKAPAHST